MRLESRLSMIRRGAAAALLLGWCGWLAGTTGCASMPEGQELARDTSTNLRDLRDDLVKLKESTIATASSLDNMAHGSGDARERYARFESAHDQLRKRAERMRAQSRDMNERANEYMDNWEKEIRDIDDEELREGAEARKMRVQHTLGDVRKRLAEAREAFDPYDRKLESIRRYLENDLTAEGIEEAKPKMDEAASQVRRVEAPLEGAIARLEDLSRALQAPE
jgi:septation ring formation regulator EzrA